MTHSTQTIDGRPLMLATLLGLLLVVTGCHHKRVRHTSVTYRVAQPDDFRFDGGR